MIQLQVLNKILAEKDSSIITLNNLTSEYFDEYSAEFNFIKNHLKTYNKLPDIHTFMESFPKFDVIEVNEPNNYLLSELAREKNTKAIATAINKARPLLMNGDNDGAASLIREALDTSLVTAGLNCVDLIHDKSRYDSYRERCENHEKAFISTGFPELDRLLGGGWDVKEEVATIVARSGIGKSWLLLKAAGAAAEAGKTVGLYSGEMSANKVGFRVDSLIGHISNGAMVHGEDFIKNQYRLFLDKLDECPGHLYVLTPEQLGGPATISALRAFIEKYNIDILFIDQHSLLEDERRGKTPVEKAANISKDIKILQTTMQIPIISASQQNREKLEDSAQGQKQFDLTQIAQSDRIAQDSSVVIFIERVKDQNLFKLHMLKSRDNGDGKVLTYNVNLNEGKFQYIPDETSTQEEVEQTGYSAEDTQVF